MTDSAGMPYGQPRLELRNISKAFGAVQALTSVDFAVLPGEVMGLVGDNGAGKSTLIKIMAGAYTPDTGKIFVEGREVHLTSPQEANHQGIETVYLNGKRAY